MTTPALFTGQNITRSKTEELVNVSLQELVGKMSDEKSPLATQVNLLQHLRKIDLKQYQEQKKQLPFFIGASFRDNLRNSRNFIGIHYFVLDLDGLSAYNLTVQGVKNRVKDDNRVFLAFASPSGDGVKIVFQLEEPVTDASRFHSFYKTFTSSFAAEHELENVTDYRTFDVTRVCFLSKDPELYYNPKAAPVTTPVAAQPAENLPVHDDVPEVNALPSVANNTAKPVSNGDDVIQQIRENLNPNVRKKEKQIHTPEEVEQARQLITQAMEDKPVSIQTEKPIHYGHQFTFTSGKLMAVINIYYGKAGFSVVKTTKKGHHPEFTATMKEWLDQLLSDLHEPFEHAGEILAK